VVINTITHNQFQMMMKVHRLLVFLPHKDQEVTIQILHLQFSDNCIKINNSRLKVNHTFKHFVIQISYLKCHYNSFFFHFIFIANSAFKA